MANEKVIVDFGANTDAFVAGANEVKNKVNDLKGSLISGLKGAIFATFSIEALKLFREEFKGIVEQLEVARRRTHANVEDLQVWDKQMQKIGGSLDDVARLMEKLAIAREKALEDPSSSQAKGLIGLGYDRVRLLQTEVPEMLKEIQRRTSEAGTTVGALGYLMDVFGEKSVKNLTFFTDSFEKTQSQMKRTGNLIDSELISKFKELQKISKQLDIGSALFGGKEGKGQLIADLESAWVQFKIWLAAQHVPFDTGHNGRDYAANKKEVSRKAESVLNTEVEYLRVTSIGKAGDDNIKGANIAGFLTPGQYEEIGNKRNDRVAEREQQIKRIEQLRHDNAEKAKTDEQKLNDLYAQRNVLVSQMIKLENQNNGKTEFLSLMETALRMVPQIGDLQDKVDKQKEEAEKKKEAEEKHAAEQRERDLNSFRHKFGGEYQMNDSLVTTGNFLGTNRTRIESVQDRHTELLEGIFNTLVDIKNKSGGSNALSDFPLN